MKAWTSAWRKAWPTRKFRIGDYVLSGGELGAAVMIDTITRLIPGALGNAASARQESFSRASFGDSGKLASMGPTAPADRAGCWIIRITPGRVEFRGIRKWRRSKALERPGGIVQTCWNGSC